MRDAPYSPLEHAVDRRAVDDDDVVAFVIADVGVEA